LLHKLERREKHIKFGSENPKGRHCLGGLGHGVIVLKMSYGNRVSKIVLVSFGLAGCCEHGTDLSGFIKKPGMS
jgi:hypothetical protein